MNEGGPLVVGIGGTTRTASTTNRALAAALAAAREAGTRTTLFDGNYISNLPIYCPEEASRTDKARELIEAIRASSGVIIATPGYHGGMSGLVKNALDFLEDLRTDTRPYLDGRAVGCIVTAFGVQACGSTLAGLRAIVHALRGWPTPLGAALRTDREIFDVDGRCVDESARTQLEIVGAQVAGFARGMR